MGLQKEEILEKVVSIIHEVTDTPPGDIHMDSSCYDDIGIESFDVVDINFRIEQVFGLTIDEDSFWNMKTILENPTYFNEDNMLTSSGIEQMQERIPELEIPADVLSDGYLPIEKLFSIMKVKNIVDYIASNINGNNRNE